MQNTNLSIYMSSHLLPATAANILPPLLHKIYPAMRVIHVGSGQGLGALHQWRNWQVPHALLADPQTAPWVAPALAQHPGWSHSVAVVAETEMKAVWHASSNTAESGLLSSARLQTIWPNLKDVNAEPQQTTTIDKLVTEYFPTWAESSIGNWLLVDCFPALPILQGAVSSLQNCSVVWIRVVIDPTLPDLEHAQLATIQNLLELHQFTQLGVMAGLHPAVGEAIFVRNWPALLEEKNDLMRDKQSRGETELSQLAEHLRVSQQHQELLQQQQKANLAIFEKEKSDLAAARDADAQEKAKAIIQRDAIFLEKKQLAAAYDALTQEKNDLIAAHDAEVAVNAEVIAQLDAVCNEKNQLQVAHDALIMENSDLTAARDAEAQEKAKAIIQRDAIFLEKKQLAAAYDALTQEKNDLIATHDAEVAVNAEVIAQLDAVSNEKNQLQVAHDALIMENSDLTAARDVEAQEKAKAIIQRDAIFLEKKQLAAAYDALTQEKNDLIAAHDAEVAVNAEVIAQLDAVRNEKNQLLATRDTLIKEKSDLAATRDAEELEKAKAIAQLDAVLVEKKQLAAAYDALIQEKNDLTTARNAEASAKAEVIAQLNAVQNEKNQLLATRDTLIKEKSDLATIREALIQENTSLVRALDEQVKLSTERQRTLSAQQQEAATLQRRIHQLESDNHENTLRQKLQQEEFIKAEAQIELIKDLLLREAGI